MCNDIKQEDWAKHTSLVCEAMLKHSEAVRRVVVPYT